MGFQKIAIKSKLVFIALPILNFTAPRTSQLQICQRPIISMGFQSQPRAETVVPKPSMNYILSISGTKMTVFSKNISTKNREEHLVNYVKIKVKQLFKLNACLILLHK
jgi:hypothetical protein